MNKELEVLILEDTPADVVLINNELRKAGVAFHAKRVETREEFLRAVERHPPDLILSDHGLPSFDGFTALKLAKEKCPDTPFIFVTGARGEDVAIQTFEQGATDYVLKNQLANLAPAVQRALREADERARRKRAEAERDHLIEELKEALARVRSLTGMLAVCSSCNKIRDDQGQWYWLEDYLLEHSDATLTHGLCPECSDILSTRRPSKRKAPPM